MFWSQILKCSLGQYDILPGCPKWCWQLLRPLYLSPFVRTSSLEKGSVSGAAMVPLTVLDEGPSDVTPLALEMLMALDSPTLLVMMANGLTLREQWAVVSLVVSANARVLRFLFFAALSSSRKPIVM